MRAPIALPCVLLLACGAEPIGSSASTTAPTTADATSSGGSTDVAPSTGVDPGTSSGGASESMTGTPTTGGPDTGDTSGTDDTGDGPTPGAFCPPIPACDDPPPTLPGQQPEESGYSRGRDMLYVEGDPQWVLAKFTHLGWPLDKDMVGATVRVFLQRGCAGDWLDLGTTVTTDDGDHPIVEGVEDSGGRVYFQIPAEHTLGPGRHRVHLIEDSEFETADLLIDVVPAGAPFFVSDVDGTLTTSENEEAWDFLVDTIPDANPFAAQALTLLASKGYRPFYITARPEWLHRRTHEFVELRGFPPGLVHTTTVYEGATGNAAALYKSGEFALLEQKGLVPAWVFGNKDSDALAFDNAGVQPLDHRVFFQFTDAEYGGRRIDSYEELLAEFEALPSLCE
jgi:hypothetical protein